jgi:hypothetical protein
MRIHISAAIMAVLIMVTCLFANEGAGGLEFGLRSLTDVKDLNNTIADRYDKDFGTSLFQIGGHGYGVIGGFVIGGEGGGIFNYNHIGYSRPNDIFLSGTEEGTLSLGGGYGALDVGWQWRMSHVFNLIPMAQIGYGGMEVDANPINTGITTGGSGDMMRDSDLRSASQGCFIAGARVMLNYHLLLGQGNRGYGGLKFALIAGYQQWMMPTGWDANHVDLNNLPDATLSGAYLMLSIGGVGGSYDGGKHKGDWK